MQYRFVYGHHADFPKLHYGYMLEISNLIELLNYQEKCSIPRITKSFAHLSKSINEEHHPDPRDGLARDLYWMTRLGGDSPVKVAGDLAVNLLEGQLDMIQHGPILIQKSGGYMPATGVKEQHRLVVDELVWPSKKLITTSDITISRWPEGQHYYVSHEGVDIGKFNNADEADTAAEDYVTKHNGMI